MRKIRLKKIVGNYKISFEIVLEWKSHLEIFSLPQAMEKSRQFFLPRTDSLQKTVVGCP